MKIKIKRPCLVSGYGNRPLMRGSVVEPNSVEEAKQLVDSGLAEKVGAGEKLTIEPQGAPPLSGDSRLTDENGKPLSGVTGTVATAAGTGTPLAGTNVGQSPEDKAKAEAQERYKAFVNRTAEDVIANIQALTDEQKPALPAVLEVEKAGKNRKTVVEAIEAAMADKE